jgi:hypothetical protein
MPEAFVYTPYYPNPEPPTTISVQTETAFPTTHVQHVSGQEEGGVAGALAGH